MSLSGHPVSGTAAKAVLTGPTGGLGTVFLDELSRAGWQVLALSRHAPKLSPQPGIIPVSVDLAEPSSLNAFVRGYRDWLSETELLINNAGSAGLGAAHLLGTDVVMRDLQLMQQSPIALSLAVIPGMLQRKRGVILNITSLAGETGIPFMAGYTAAKAGLSAFSKALQLEYAGTGLSIVDWCPADIHSEFNQSMHQGHVPRVVWRKLEAHMAKAPPADILRPALRALLSGKRPAPLRYPGRTAQVWAALVAGRLMPRRLLLSCVRRYYGLS